jgi:tetratricopeptide (TPR) repeat protein
MKNIFKLLLFSVLFSSCSNMLTKSNKKIEAELTEAEMERIENEDFLPRKEVRYRVNLDHFDIKDDSADNTDSLLSESIARISDFKLKEISNSSKEDPISKIISLCYQQEFKQAELVMDTIYKKYKSHPSYWNQIGTCYFLQNNLRKALLYYNKARSFSKRYAPAINNLGVIYQKQGLEQKALLAFKKASQLSSFSLTPVFNLAQIYLKYGFSRRARKLLEVLLIKGAQDHEALTGIAVSYLQENKLTKALEYFNKIPNNKKSSAEIGINYSLTLKLLGHNQQAISAFENISTSKLGNNSSYYKNVSLYVRGK